MTVESDSSFPLKCKSCTNEARDILHHSVCLSGYKCVCLVHCVLSATVEADGSYVCLAWVTRHIYYSSSTQKKCFVLRPNIKHTHTHACDLICLHRNHTSTYSCTNTTHGAAMQATTFYIQTNDCWYLQRQMRETKTCPTAAVIISSTEIKAA